MTVKEFVFQAMGYDAMKKPAQAILMRILRLLGNDTPEDCDILLKPDR